MNIEAPTKDSLLNRSVIRLSRHNSELFDKYGLDMLNHHNRVNSIVPHDYMKEDLEKNDKFNKKDRKERELFLRCQIFIF